jgi:protein-tyrosine phosphatase
MIDLHSHLLPGIDDGAATMDMTLEMARMAVADGVRIMACTPHMHPPRYTNTATTIQAAVAEAQKALDDHSIDLRLIAGADVHLGPDLLSQLRSGHVQKLDSTSYFLLEPSHTIAPPQFERFVRTIIDAGYKPILTHPERLTWIEQHYALICAVDEAGAALQITAGALLGTFGARPQYWAERMLAEGRVDILASDAHDTRRRVPGLSAGMKAAAAIVGDEAARMLVLDNPATILRDLPLPQKTRAKTKDFSPKETTIDRLRKMWTGQMRA